MNGIVQEFNKEKGYGFIHGNDGRRYFVHFTSIQMEGFRTLTVGQAVEFEISNTNQGFQATNVRLIPSKSRPSAYQRNIVVEHNTEDKQYWCKKGELIEEAFVREIVPLINRNLIVHPQKRAKKTHIDLLNLDSNTVADLKTQNTPFFTAARYNFEPQYTVTFNAKDYRNYKENYPEATIYWWVNWTQLTWKNYTVAPLYGVWEIPFSTMKTVIEGGKAPLHEYIFRRGDRVNANDSYLFDLRNFNRLL